MGKEILNLTFDEWLAFNFDHPVTDPEWHWGSEADWLNLAPAVSVAYITRAFETSGEVLKSFSDEQLNQGFWFLIGANSDEIHTLFEGRVPLAERMRCVRSIYALFEQCFAKRCSDSLSHFGEKARPLNSACYMWWDIFPTWGEPDDKDRLALDEEFLNVMRLTLQIDSVACRESALHGLGHWQLSYPDETEAIINDFLNSAVELKQPLRDYALAAAEGMVQ